jgi:RHS repeat-associated protein
LTGNESRDDTQNHYSYDCNGNMQQDLGNGIGFVVYDIHNLPVTVYKTTGTVLTASYDATGQRACKYDGSTTHYYVNGANGSTEVITKTDLSKATHNIWGNDNLGQVKRDGSTWTRFYYLKDHLGSIRVTVNSSGAIDSYNDFDPFGMAMESRNSVSSADARYKFTGKERDAETNYDYFGARYYDGRIGRWMQVDPLAEKYSAWSPYTYVRDNPLLRLDPTGLTDIVIHIYRLQETTKSTIGIFVMSNDADKGQIVGFTLEPPDKNNKEFEGRILPGEYAATRSTSTKFGAVIRLEDKNNRTDIEMHQGSEPKHTEGCILPGSAAAKDAISGSLDKKNEIIKSIDKTIQQDKQGGEKTTIRVVVEDPQPVERLVPASFGSVLVKRDKEQLAR